MDARDTLNINKSGITTWAAEGIYILLFSVEMVDEF